MWVYLCPPLPTYTKFYENQSLRSPQRSEGLPFLLMRNLHHLFIHHYRQRDNENLSGLSRIAGSPQKEADPYFLIFWVGLKRANKDLFLRPN